MMNRVLKGIRPSGEEDPTTARIRQLNSESESIRQYLYQIFQAPEAVHISETQIRILRDSGEPFYHGDVWVNGRFTNETPDKAAFVSVVEAMAEIGHPFARVQELYSIHPVRGLQTRVSRSRRLFFWEGTGVISRLKRNAGWFSEYQESLTRSPSIREEFSEKAETRVLGSLKSLGRRIGTFTTE